MERTIRALAAGFFTLLTLGTLAKLEASGALPANFHLFQSAGARAADPLPLTRENNLRLMGLLTDEKRAYTSEEIQFMIQMGEAYHENEATEMPELINAQILHALTRVEHFTPETTPFVRSYCFDYLNLLNSEEARMRSWPALNIVITRLVNDENRYASRR